MSITATKFSIYFIVCAGVLFVGGVRAQQFEARIKIDAASTIVGVEGETLRGSSAAQVRNWTFADSAAGAENLGERVFDFNLQDAQKRAVAVKKFSASEYLADAPDALFWNYKIDVKSSPNPNTAAHVSRLKNEQGILMLGDLLPQFPASGNQPISARIKFELPEGWTIITGEKRIAENTFAVENVEKSVFLIGKNWREKKIANGDLSLAISGDWQFSDEEAAQTVQEIFAEYKQFFGEIPNRKIQISIVHFPKEIKFGRWEAETRGANLTILSSDMPFKTLSLQRFHEQLRHELFHLWIPNNLALEGNYDWFYEGFTIYQALKTGLKMNQIRFEDFLDTLAQAYNLDNLQTQKVSLVEASKTRLSGANPQVYARGMIAAFLCDVALLRASKGKRSIADVFLAVYQRHRLPNKFQDGNAAVLDVLNGYGELNSIVEKYIRGAGKIEWTADLASAGIEVREENSFARLKIVEKLRGRQKDLLNELGYNNWRKVSVKTK